MDAMTFLREHAPLFAGLSDESLAALAEASQLLSFNAGQSILLKGTTVDGLHVLVAGTAGVYAKQANKGIVHVATLAPGDACGETSIVEMGVANATVKALEDGAKVLLIPQEAFRHVLQRDEAFAVRVNTLIRSRQAAPQVPA
ncbi:MAG: cyclic nucleotide-binding domain-containing protein [Elusimicrobia bacterium]|nr:cyclic nucleotide-binding domain-containing protein [Elusimicrobiota bacterium]